MQEFSRWMLDTIRKEGASFNWMEEQRFELTASIKLTVSQLLEGKTAILVTDRKHKWFEHYVSSSINQLSRERPLIPIVDLGRLHYESENMNSATTIQMLIDLLELSYGSSYFFWYIGRGSDSSSEIAKRSSSSSLWIMNESYVGAIYLNTNDSKLDIKLLQLYRLFELSLNAALYGEVDVSK